MAKKVTAHQLHAWRLIDHLQSVSQTSNAEIRAGAALQGVRGAWCELSLVKRFQHFTFKPWNHEEAAISLTFSQFAFDYMERLVSWTLQRGIAHDSEAEAREQVGVSYYAALVCAWG
ncbi:hypothetical protein HC256_010671 [Beauveria bassiana]|nr:hypothetical protein HC256_010671 [Beauveria bassiana]